MKLLKEEYVSINFDRDYPETENTETFVINAEGDYSQGEEEVGLNPGYENVRIVSIEMPDGRSIENDEEINNFFSPEEMVQIMSQLEEKFNSMEHESGPDPDDAYERAKELRMYENKKPSLKQFIQEEVLKIHKKTLLESKKAYLEKELKLLSENSGLKLASGNPLDGKSKDSAKNIIHKLYSQVDHGQRYRDDAWQNVHKIFNLFKDYGFDTVGGYDAEYNPGGINVDALTPQWKKWYYDFNFTDNKGIPRTITYVLIASAGGTPENAWSSYDITFYSIN